MTSRLIEWYNRNHRDLPWRETKDPYFIWISEIMLQQTRVETVIPYYHRFSAALPNLAALADAPEDLLLKLWEGLGYYSRVRNMQKAARQLQANFGGVFPRDYGSLCSLCGIGRYTAGAIGSISFDLPYPAVDGNVLRVYARMTEDECDIRLPEVRQRAEAWVFDLMPPPSEGCGLLTQALMELGACVCVPNGPAKCGECPWAEHCLAHERGHEGLLPVKSAPTKRKTEAKTVLFFRQGEKLFLRKRPHKGLLAGMWEPYVLDGAPDTASALLRLLQTGDSTGCPADTSRLTPESITYLGTAKHVFTHLEWHMTGFAIQVPPGAVLPTAGDAGWFDSREIDTEKSIPTAYGKLLNKYRET